jgi:hypothetical protein
MTPPSGATSCRRFAEVWQSPGWQRAIGTGTAVRNRNIAAAPVRIAGAGGTLAQKAESAASASCLRIPTSRMRSR